MDDRRDDEREGEDQLPEHEIDDTRSVGGGMMSSGGTAVDRGTGTLSGSAAGEAGDASDAGASGGDESGRWSEDTDPLSGPDDEPEETVPSPYHRA